MCKLSHHKPKKARVFIFAVMTEPIMAKDMQLEQQLLKQTFLEWTFFIIEYFSNMDFIFDFALVPSISALWHTCLMHLK